MLSLQLFFFECKSWIKRNSHKSLAASVIFFFSNKIKRNIPSETTVITSTITFFQKNRPGINIKIGHPQPNARSSEISQRELSEQRRNEDEEEKKIAIT